MSKDELGKLLSFLVNVRNSEYVADQMMQEECDELIEIIRKEYKIRKALGMRDT